MGGSLLLLFNVLGGSGAVVAELLPGDVTISRQGPGGVTLSRAGPIALPVQSIGPLNPTSVENDDTAGTNAWSNITNALNQDDTYATANTDTYYLAFAFDASPLPDGATVTGIVAEIDAHQGFGRALDSVRLKSGGAYVGDEKTTGALPTSDTDTYTAVGGSEDDWNAGLTASDIKASDFRVGFRYPFTLNAGPYNVDHPRLTIYYYTLSIAAGATTVSRSGPGAVTVGRKTS